MKISPSAKPRNRSRRNSCAPCGQRAGGIEAVDMLWIVRGRSPGGRFRGGQRPTVFDVSDCHAETFDGADNLAVMSQFMWVGVRKKSDCSHSGMKSQRSCGSVTAFSNEGRSPQTATE